MAAPKKTASLLDTISAYGADPAHVRLFTHDPAPEVQDYLDLIDARDSEPAVPDGVAEAQGRPVLYFIDETRLSGAGSADEAAVEVRSLLACRGERAYLARVEPGRIRVTPVAFEDVDAKWEEYTPGSLEGRTLFSRLVNGTVDWDEGLGRGDAVFDRLRTLLRHSASRLAETEQLRPDILSLLGRALFFRFLRDRDIVTEESIPLVCPGATGWQDCFGKPENAAATCRWLDETFNGNFLPLTDSGDEAFFRRVGDLTGGGVFNHLTAVVLGAEPVGGTYQLNFNWGLFDFAHVPVGLLSQVYEDFCWHWETEEAASTSVHYTPKNIAVTLLDDAFHGIERPEEVRALDPACGAGVFLVLAFRRIYREIWKARGRRPDRRTIRKILNRQLTGFDISENALRLAALSLYLTALELDPRPQPLAELGFDDLRGKVLFNVRQSGADRPTGPALGSIGPAVTSEHDGKYDVVISNPPWTSVPSELGAAMQAAVQAVLRRAGADGAAAYENPDNNPDIPFLFRATEWCVEDGRIAMALPARFLLKSERIPALARKTLFRFLDVTGVISGVNLAKTNVWPGTDQPFILLFARNRRPAADSRTQLICPHYDEDLNGRGEFRLDADASRAVDPRGVEEEPWLWKAWLVGTALDVEVVRKLTGQPAAPKVIDYWKEHGLATKQGYVVSESAPQKDAGFLQGLPDLSGGADVGFVVGELPRFTRATLHRPRTPEVYRAPLVVVKQSAGTDRARGFAALAFSDTAYSSSYYGYSTVGHAKPELLARYLHLAVHSSLWLHFGLVTGAQFGAERNKLQKQSVDDFPLVRVGQLSPPQLEAIGKLSARLTEGDARVFDEIDRLFGQIYGLDDTDLEVVRDTLEVGQAYRETSGERACAPPTMLECARFVERLRQMLAPLVEWEPKDLPAIMWYPDGGPQESQTFGAVLLGGNTGQVDERLYFEKVVPLADATGATQVIMPVAGGGLLLGLRNQYRYWTATRARLLAAEIARAYIDELSW